MPEQIEVSKAWVKLIKMCQQSPYSYSVLTIRVVNGSPVSLVDYRPAIRFDKDDGKAED